MYLAVAGACAAGNAGTPLAASIDNADFTDVVLKDVEGGGAFTTSQGQFVATVSPSGGSGSYTFSWSITEDADPTSSFSVASIFGSFVLIFFLKPFFNNLTILSVCLTDSFFFIIFSASKLAFSKPINIFA